MTRRKLVKADPSELHQEPVDWVEQLALFVGLVGMTSVIAFIIWIVFSAWYV